MKPFKCWKHLRGLNAIPIWLHKSAWLLWLEQTLITYLLIKSISTNYKAPHVFLYISLVAHRAKSNEMDIYQ